MKTQISKRQVAKIQREICRLLKSLKGDILDDYRASDDADDNTPGMCVTLATKDFSSWAYQTGDNSYTGGCYHFPHWGVVYLYRRSNSKELSADAVDQMADGVCSDGETEIV